MKNEITRIFFIEPYYTAYWNEATGAFRLISNSGIKRGQQMTLQTNSNGYFSIKLGNYALTVHQIIASRIFGTKKPGYVVNHLDGNKKNNSLANLEYVTIAENVKHAISLGNHPASDPKRSGRYKHGRAIKKRISQYKHEWYLAHKKHEDTSA